MNAKRIAGTYFLVDGKIVSEGKVLKEADARTFRVLCYPWAMDHRYVWYANFLKRLPDVQSFRALNPLYAVDAKHVYRPDKVVRGADPATFVALDSGLEHELGTLGSPLNGGYGADASSVFYDGNVVKGAHRDSFISLTQGYARDIEAIYCEGFRLPRVDPKTWHRLGGDFSTDGIRVYFLHSLIPGAVAERFSLLDPATENFAYDGKRFYCNNKPIARERYVHLARQFWTGNLQTLDYVSSGKWEDLQKRSNWSYESPYCPNTKGA